MKFDAAKVCLSNRCEYIASRPESQDLMECFPGFGIGFTKRKTYQNCAADINSQK
jgi:hypothetical protein